VCLIDRLRGDPDPQCAPPDYTCVPGLDADCGYAVPCALAADVQRRIHCSCRCDGPDPAARYCQCPEGFSCEPLPGDPQHALAGSYCMRSDQPH
jgi:hypothetical protein